MKLNHFLAFAMLAAAIVPVPGSAAPKAWMKVTSPHFELYTTAGEKRGREAVEYFEQVRDLFVRIRGERGSAKGKVRLVAFSSEKEYEPFKVNDFAAAYYLGAEALDVIVMRAIREDYFPVAVHEYTHCWLKNAGAEIPAWLNEGLAEIHSTLKSTGKQVALGHPLPGRLRELQESRWIPLETLVRVGHDSPEYNEKSRAGAFYAESWLLTHMLYLSKPFNAEWDKFASALAQTGSAEEAFRKAYGLSVKQVEDALRQYARSERMNYALFEARVEKPSDAPKIEAVDETEAGVVQAQLLGLLHKTSEANQIYEQLAQSNPNSWKLAEARALTAWQNRDLEGAKRHFSRAMDLKAESGSMYFQYASLIYSEDPERALAAARRAVELAPEHQDAHFLLGDLLYRKRMWTEALDEFAKVKEVKRERSVQLFTMIAHAAYASGNKSKAVQYARAARKYAAGPEETRLAEDILRYVTEEPQSEQARQTPAPVESESGEKAETAGGESSHMLSMPRKNMAEIEGQFVNLECAGNSAKLHILAGGRKLVFLVADPTRVVIQAPEGRPVLEFQCGTQKPRRVRVEYEAAAGLAPGVMGTLRALEFYE